MLKCESLANGSLLACEAQEKFLVKITNHRNKIGASFSGMLLAICVVVPSDNTLCKNYITKCCSQVFARFFFGSPIYLFKFPSEPRSYPGRTIYECTVLHHA